MGNRAGHAFISYVREDSDEVDELQQVLEAAGIPVWRDTEDLWPGQDWGAKIRQAITDDALVFIACFSSRSVARGTSYQNEELVLAIEQLRRRPPDDPWLIPVRFDDCRIPDRELGAGRTLASIHCADLFGPGSGRAAERLVTTIKRRLGDQVPLAGRRPDQASMRLSTVGELSIEAVERVMLARQVDDRTEVAMLEDGVLVEHYADRAGDQSLLDNVYLGRVQHVLPSMEAAFIDIGQGRNAVLFVGDVNVTASGQRDVVKSIESALKPGQSIIVQVTKDPVGSKGARLTTQVSLPGRYLVYVPGTSTRGISRKLPEPERTRLKRILDKVLPGDSGIIAKTAAAGASQEELRHDFTRLSAQWRAIGLKAEAASPPDLLAGQPVLTIQIIRATLNGDLAKVVIAGDSEWELVNEYVREWTPSLASRLERWTGNEDLFAAYRVDEQLATAQDRKVWLPGGGSVVIEITDAMTVINVSVDRSIARGGTLEQVITGTNLEAAGEIVRQLRLRDVDGVIAIHFIDMDPTSRDLVLRRLIECLARDRGGSQVVEVTSLGMVHMTRRRVGHGWLVAARP